MAGPGSGGGSGGPDPRAPVLRINQLDAFELDSALEQLLWERFSACFQHLRPGLLTPVEPELKAVLQLVLWRFTICSSSATTGQALLGLCYHDARSRSARYVPLAGSQKLGLLLLGAGPRWLRERSHSLLLRPPGAGPGTAASADAVEWLRRRLRRCLALLSGLAQAASLLNFLVFLREGRHPSLTERILGTRAVFSRPQGVRDVGFQYMNRELLWHGFAEFLIFLLPLVDVKRAKAAVRLLLLGPGEGEDEASGEGPGAWRECALCGEWPTMPHTIGCPHVFCYYCAKSHAIADGFLKCPKCGLESGRVEPVTPQTEMTEIHTR